jgi:hypothetical protein
MRAVKAISFLTCAALLIAWSTPSRAEPPAAYCQRVGTDDATRSIPEALVPAINATFRTRMPPHVAMDTTVFRCAEHRVMVCTVGANLPCGKADTSRMPNAGVIQWCRDNRDASFVPAAATGHDTIYEWHCHAGTPRISRQTLHVDQHGFVTEFWKPLP